MSDTDAEMELELAAASVANLVECGFTGPQAEALARLFAHSWVVEMQHAEILGRIAMLLLLDDAKPVPPAADFRALQVVVGLRDVAKRKLRADLAGLVAPGTVAMVEDALSARWADLVERFKA